MKKVQNQLCSPISTKIGTNLLHDDCDKNQQSDIVEQTIFIGFQAIYLFGVPPILTVFDEKLVRHFVIRKNTSTERPTTKKQSYTIVL